MTCIVLGDSIAVGVHQYLLQCALSAKVGITSSHWLASNAPDALKTPKDVTVISLGSNDVGMNDLAAFFTIRDKIKSKLVIWLLPANNPEAVANIHIVAHMYGDQTLSLAIFRLSPDGVHPIGPAYRTIANQIKDKL